MEVMNNVGIGVGVLRVLDFYLEGDKRNDYFYIDVR